MGAETNTTFGSKHCGETILTVAIGRGVRTSVLLLDQLAPGGSLEWTVSGSGLGGISDLRLQDTLGDGQRMDTVFHPQVVIRRGSSTLFSGDLLGWSGVRSAETATTAIKFDLAPTLRAAGLPGGLTDDSTVAVTFHSVIGPLYAARQAPTLGRVLGQGDPLVNTALFSGTVAGVLASSDAVSAAVALPSSVLATSIYAVNGVLVVGAAHAGFGDIVTYRVRVEMPLTAAHRVQLTAMAPGLTGAFVFDAVGAAGAPPSGHVRFGSGSYTATQPLVTPTTDAAGHPVVQFDFGDVLPVYGSGPGTIEMLVSAPLTAGTPLAATVTETEANSFGTGTAVTAVSPAITLDEPTLRIQTATVYASNDAATWTGTGGPFGYSPDFGQFGGIISSAGMATEPFADRLSGVDAGDDVTFVIAVESLVPGAKAYDVTIRSALPDGFVVPDGGASITVSNGAGTPLAYSGDLFDPQGGLLLDPKAPIAGYDADSGRNVLLISYTLHSIDRLDLSAPSHASTAQIIRYATQPGWVNRAPLAAAAANTATTEVVNIPPSVAVALVATGNPDVHSTLLALGGTATFQLTATLPEGLSRGLDLALALPSWLTAVSARVIMVGADISPQTQVADGHGGISFGDTLNAPDRQIPNAPGTPADQVQIEVTVRPTGVPDGPTPHTAAIPATVSIGPPGQASTVASSIVVGVADPVPPSITLAFAGASPAALWNGGIATYRFIVTLPPGFSTAFRILNSLPSGLAYLPGSVRIIQADGVASSGLAALSLPSVHLAGLLLTLDFGAVNVLVPVGRQVVVELQAQVAAPVGTTLVNSATVETGYASASAVPLVALVANTAPAVTGLPSTEAARDDTALAPFAGIVVTDPDTGQQQTLQITFSAPAAGILSNLGSGRYDTAAGVYTVTGTAGAVMAAAAALRLTLTRHQVSLGQQVQMDLSAQVRDSAGAASAAVVTHLVTVATNAAPVIRNAAPGQAVIPGVPVRLFTGLLLQDADTGQTETLTIQFADPGAGTLRSMGPGRYDPVSGLFTSTGTLAALMAEAAGLVFTAASRAIAAETLVTITIDDGAGGVARDTSSMMVLTGVPPPPTDVASLSARPLPPAVIPAQLFTGSAPANLVVVPAGSNLLTGTAGRDAYFVDGNAAAPQWDTLTGFSGGDTVVLWGFRGGNSAFTWSDDDGPSGHTGRTLRADIAGVGTVTTSLTFAAQVASATDRFAISTGRFNGLDYLSIMSAL